MLPIFNSQLSLKCLYVLYVHFTARHIPYQFCFIDINLCAENDIMFQALFYAKTKVKKNQTAGYLLWLLVVTDSLTVV